METSLQVIRKQSRGKKSSEKEDWIGGGCSLEDAGTAHCCLKMQSDDAKQRAQGRRRQPNKTEKVGLSLLV